MKFNLSGVNLAILGGDAREIILAEHLAGLNAHVKVLGLPARGKNIMQCQDLDEALDSVKAVILPVPGVNEELRLHSAFPGQPLFLTENSMRRLAPGTPILVGVAKSPLKKLVRRLDLRLIEVMEIDEVAILNSIPSAEGAIQLAMQKTPITIHGSKVWVFGFGRTGTTLARVLNAMGAKTTVIARNSTQLARAREMGLEISRYENIKNISQEVDIIFNTVPCLVLGQSVLGRLPSGVLIIDIASAPGGTDFETAKKLGIEAILAPGLPGKVAPKTAGQILSKVVPRLLAGELTLH